MKFCQERFEEAQQYDELFYDAIYERMPNTIKIISLEKTKDNNGERGVRDIVTLNDFLYNIDAVVISDNNKTTNFQFKTTSTNSVWFDVVSVSNNKYRYIKGAYTDPDSNKTYFIECGNADFIAFYFIAYNQMYFFNTDIVKNIFRYSLAWKNGTIQKGDNGCSYIKIPLDSFLDLSERCFDYLLSGKGKEK